MSVIAKLYAADVRDFGTGSSVTMQCVAENDLMAAYATSEEDKLFSRYSPWGEMRLNQRSGWAVFTSIAEIHPPAAPRYFYAMLISLEEAGAEASFDGCAAYIKVDCYSRTKFAQDGSRVELRETYG